MRLYSDRTDHYSQLVAEWRGLIPSFLLSLMPRQVNPVYETVS
jgi:hypothetical protein